MAQRTETAKAVFEALEDYKLGCKCNADMKCTIDKPNGIISFTCCNCGYHDQFETKNSEGDLVQTH